MTTKATHTPMSRAEILDLLKKRTGNEAAVMHAYLSVPGDERKARRESALAAWRERAGLDKC